MFKRRTAGIFLALLMCVTLTACAGESRPAFDAVNERTVENIQDDGDAALGNKILVAYYSPNGQIQKVAGTIRNYTGGTLQEIKVAEDYPDNSAEFEETVKEELREGKRPELLMDISSLDTYDTVLIGFPIWYGQVPVAVCTFLESFDFTGKKVVPYIVGEDADLLALQESLKESCETADWEECTVISDEEFIAPWLKQVGIFSELIRISAGDEVLYGGLYHNEEAQDFTALLPMTANLYIPADFARAFNLDTELSDGGYRTRTYEIGKIAYWPEGPAIAVFVNDSEPQTVVPVIHLGQIFSDASNLAEYGEITIERVELEE